ncbi:hypothetical protein [Niabella beijingensis]|uniref:hypothetical protein n=1 Tax=Niabella beijingensis TaxID=2872700 RepID=UPI001CBEAA86|nr:hypothetical protein [Niabella beijingensis]MBZ4189450.1 hypothetical protein [Niabella beijingensis]
MTFLFCQSGAGTSTGWVQDHFLSFSGTPVQVSGDLSVPGQQWPLIQDDAATHNPIYEPGGPSEQHSLSESAGTAKPAAPKSVLLKNGKSAVKEPAEKPPRN